MPPHYFAPKALLNQALVFKNAMTSARSCGFFRPANAILVPGMNFIGADAGEPGAAGGVTPFAILLILCAAMSWAVSNVVSRLAQRAAPGFDPLGFVVWSCPAPVLAFIALTALTDPTSARWLHVDAWAALPLAAWGSVAYLGWVATILAYGMWTRLLTRYPANRVAPFSLGVPVVGLAAGMLVLDEVVTAWQWVGTGFVAAALLCVVLGGRWAQRRRGAGPTASAP